MANYDTETNTEIKVEEIIALMNYNIFKSRTFWTLVATFVYNVWQLASPSVPAQYSALIDFVFTSAAAYFHLQTGQSTTGTN